MLSRLNAVDPGIYFISMQNLEIAQSPLDQVLPYLLCLKDIFELSWQLKHCPTNRATRRHKHYEKQHCRIAGSFDSSTNRQVWDAENCWNAKRWGTCSGKIYGGRSTGELPTKLHLSVMWPYWLHPLGITTSSSKSVHQWHWWSIEFITASTSTRFQISSISTWLNQSPSRDRNTTHNQGPGWWGHQGWRTGGCRWNLQRYLGRYVAWRRKGNWCLVIIDLIFFTDFVLSGCAKVPQICQSFWPQIEKGIFEVST